MQQYCGVYIKSIYLVTKYTDKTKAVFCCFLLSKYEES